jgi:hypothetical protein
MDIEIDADGLLRIRAARLGTQELDQLIHQLAEVRTTMEPEVPRRQDEAVDAVTFTVQDEPEAYVTFTDTSARAIWQQLGEVLSGAPPDLLQANQRG